MILDYLLNLAEESLEKAGILFKNGKMQRYKVKEIIEKIKLG
jgi:hypothetical protein